MVIVLDTLPERDGVRFVVDMNGRVFGAVRGKVYIPKKEFTEDLVNMMPPQNGNGNGHA